MAVDGSFWKLTHDLKPVADVLRRAIDAETASNSSSAPSETVTPSHSAARVTGSAPSTCVCGAPLAQRRTGRRRHTCSDRCRRLVDRVQRKMRRREDWIAAWRQADGYPRAQRRAEIKTLRAELEALRAQVTR
jgi:hypothetical protein